MPRRFPRYPVNLRLRLELPAGELETVTEDVSLAGFSAPCAELPEEGTRFGFTLHLPDGRLVTGTACAMRVGPEGLAGFSCEFEPAQQAVWEAFVAQEQASGGVWRMISRYALSEGADQEAARAVLERGPLGILFKRIGGEKPPDSEAKAVLKLHMVGENGEAYRVAFEKQPSEAPEVSAFTAAAPRLLEFARQTITRILTQEVFLKRSPQAEVAPVRLVELARGGYGFLVQHPGGKPGVMGLHGSELIVVAVDGRPVFPFFTPEDLERIASDSFRRDDERTRPAPHHEERFSTAYAHKAVDTQRPASCTEAELREALAAQQRVQSRTYGERTLRLFPELWLEIERPSWATAARGFAMEDGLALCVFLLVGPGAPRVVRLEPGDFVAILRGAAAS